MKLASGFAPITKLLNKGLTVGLGTDSAASNNRLDLFQEMRQAALIAKALSGDAATLPAHHALAMATLHGAQALGLGEQIGSIAVGKAADLCAVDLSSLGNQPCYDPIAQLVYAAGRENVSHVWVAGKCCVERNALLSADENELKDSACLWQNKPEVRHKA